MPLRCLIVDDSPSFLAAATTLLEREGLSVAGVAATGADAIRQAAALRPDVVLVDVFFGAESGIDVARRLGDGDGGGGPTVILISTHAVDGVMELIAGSDVEAGYICKTDLSAEAIRRLVSDGPGR
jgi:CheY-like chemotaxis protein